MEKMLMGMRKCLAFCLILMLTMIACFYWTSVAQAWIRDLKIDPNDPQIIYAGSLDSRVGVLKSTDGGRNWKSANAGLPAEGGVAALAINPNNTKVTYAGTLEGVYKSINGGRSWNQSLAISTGGYDYISCLAIDPNNTRIIYAGITSEKGGFVFKSTNRGLSWEDVSSGLVGKGIKYLIINPQQTKTLYVLSNFTGVYKSTDGAKSWQKLSLPTDFVTSIAIDPKQPEVLYVGREMGGGYEVLRTRNGGKTWSKTGMFPVGLSDWVRCVAVRPDLNSNVYAGVYEYGIVKSANSGRSWKYLSLGNYSYDWWEGSFVECIVFDPKNTNIIYAGTAYNGVVKSTNAGKSWRQVYSGIE